MRGNPDIIIRRISTGEILRNAYFQDMGHIGDEPTCGHLSEIVIDGEKYSSWNPCGLSQNQCYIADLRNFSKYDLYPELR